MKIVKFKGGLGNQLFQYSYLRSIELKYGCENVKSDFTYYSRISNDSIRKPRIEQLNIIHNQASRNELMKIFKLRNDSNPSKLIYKIKLYIEKTINTKYYFEKNRSYRNPLEIISHEYFDGYWQSWRYLEGIENELMAEIKPKNELSEKTKNVIDKMKNENAVFIGIRRGDYLDSSSSKRHYGNYSQNYFNKAIQIIKKNVENPILYVFSNDIEWVKKNLKLECETIYREKSDQVNDVEELFVMAACKHAIIVNSTYYWWGAWLIKNKNKVIIAPQNWFADKAPIDIIPKTWIQI